MLGCFGPAASGVMDRPAESVRVQGDAVDDDARLSRIETLWSVVRRAHQPDRPQAAAAQQDLLDQYGGAIRRYLLGALRDSDAADEVFQEFALRFVRGDFKNADPERGRFRGFVKTALYHLIVDYQRRDKRDRRQRNVDYDFADDPRATLAKMDVDLIDSWRTELLGRAWSDLQNRESATGKPFYTVLRFRADHPEMRSPQLAEALSKQLNRSINAGNVRVMVHRARELFASLLLTNVEDSLENPSMDELESELIELNLLSYCSPALDQRRKTGCE